MRRAVLHLGVPRTGSTSLQYFWTRHRAALRKLGILYPELTPPGAPPHLSHQHLGEAMDRSRPAAEREALFGQLEQALRSDADIIILSHEMLAHRRPWARGQARLLDLLRRAG